MKKIKYVILSVVILVVAGFLFYHFYTVSTGIVEKDGITYNLSKEFATIIDGKNAKKENYKLDKVRNRVIVRVNDEAFKGNQVIKKVEMPYVSYIGVNAFENTALECFDATRGTDALLSLSREAFKDSVHLKEVKLPQTAILPDSFLNCGEFSLELLDNSYIPPLEMLSETYCVSPFRNSTLKTINLIETNEKKLYFENGILFSKDLYLFNIVMGLDNIPKHKKAIFYVDKTITELKFNDDEFILLFSGISDNLTSIKINDTNPYYASLDGVLYSKDFTRLVFFPPKNSTSRIHSNVTRVESACFYGDYSNKSIVFPENVFFMMYAFVGVKSLTVDFNNPRVTTIPYIYDSNIEN